MKIQADAVWVYHLQVEIIYMHVNEAAGSLLVCLMTLFYVYDW